MSVGPDRPQAAQALLEAHACDVIISDDGLQHYALHRDIEVVVIDGSRRFGNRRCLPAGPLREPAQRILEADYVVCNGGASNDEIKMVLHMQAARNLKQPQNCKPLNEFGNHPVHAVAGIGNPSRFFNQLRHLGLSVIEHPFTDHHVYTADELCFNDDLPVLMTEKDAVKCRKFAKERYWYVPVTAETNNNFLQNLTEQLRKTDG
jgi:tetraacyldisaccharide 4'-kinase